MLVCPDPPQPASCYNEYPVVETVSAQEARTYDLVGNRTDGGAVIGVGNRVTTFNGMRAHQRTAVAGLP